MHATCLIIIHDPGMRPGPGSNGGRADECSTAEPTLLLYRTLQESLLPVQYWQNQFLQTAEIDSYKPQPTFVVPAWCRIDYFKSQKLILTNYSLHFQYWHGEDKA